MGPRPNPSSCWEDQGVQQGMSSENVIVWNEGHDWLNKRRGCGGKVFGIPLGHPTDVMTQLQRVRQDQQLLLDRIPLLFDVQSAWAFWVHCTARTSVPATYILRVVSPEQFFKFARSHDTRCGSVWEQWWESPRGKSEAARVLLTFDGLGLRSVVRNAAAAYRVSWGDSFGINVTQSWPEPWCMSWLVVSRNRCICLQRAWSQPN